ncbi:DUF2283 domain-containing protein [Actinomadura macrotermitis]|uniref:DUF2283 domain-containing protein n=1 Tax=Actinomadura macrotermitis TaxID=2585200 RepID=A0A7K0BZ26_9ACTN|nr:hypothetical protein [Actinomadura macrotermitis]
MAELKVTYDGQANAAYIYFEDPVQAGAPGSAVKMYPCDPIAVGGMINLDFDREGRVIGIEILDARSMLSPYLIEAAERLDT